MRYVCLLVALVFPVAAFPQSPARQSGNPTVQNFSTMEVKNAQVLKGLSRDQINWAMGFISQSLGVTCDFCHVRNENGMQYERDDKKEKQTARDMLRMVKSINAQNFKDQDRVTCATCHNGRSYPGASNPILDANMLARRQAAQRAAANMSALPDGAELLSKYEKAIGGEEALAKLKTRMDRWSMTTAAGAPASGETVRKVPDKWIETTNFTPNRSTVWICDGSEARIVAPNRYEIVSGADLDDVKFTADFWRGLRLTQRYSRVMTASRQEVNGHPVYVVHGDVKGSKVAEMLYFDADSGLLLRRVTFKPTALGSLADQVDFDDYRTVDGVRVPFVLTSANGLTMSTRTYSEIRFNVAVDEAKFAMPALPEKSAEK